MPGVVRWLNFFRSDDFVGTHIGPVPGSWPTNVPFDPRGHTNYWSDIDVIRYINVRRPP